MVKQTQVADTARQTQAYVEALAQVQQTGVEGGMGVTSVQPTAAEIGLEAYRKGATAARRREIETELERQQQIQQGNPPSSKVWQDASKRIHELARELTGKQPKDAIGGPQYDYRNQAWLVDGRYVACGHKECGVCYGTLHQGEAANLANGEVE